VEEIGKQPPIHHKIVSLHAKKKPLQKHVCKGSPPFLFCSVQLAGSSCADGAAPDVIPLPDSIPLPL
jgi:hypothetical protein